MREFAAVCGANRPYHSSSFLRCAVKKRIPAHSSLYYTIYSGKLQALSCDIQRRISGALHRNIWGVKAGEDAPEFSAYFCAKARGNRHSCRNTEKYPANCKFPAKNRRNLQASCFSPFFPFFPDLFPVGTTRKCPLKPVHRHHSAICMMLVLPRI